MTTSRYFLGRRKKKTKRAYIFLKNRHNPPPQVFLVFFLRSFVSCLLGVLDTQQEANAVKIAIWYTYGCPIARVEHIWNPFLWGHYAQNAKVREASEDRELRRLLLGVRPLLHFKWKDCLCSLSLSLLFLGEFSCVMFFCLLAGETPMRMFYHRFYPIPRAIPCCSFIHPSIHPCLMFHGSTPDTIHSICKSGFDRRFAGSKNGSVRRDL